MLIQLPLSQCLKIITLHSFKDREYYFLHTWHMEHSQARWHGCVCHGHPTPGKDFTPGLPNLRPKYYPSPPLATSRKPPLLNWDTEVRLEQPASFSCLDKEEQNYMTGQHASISHFLFQVQLVSLGYRVPGLPQAQIHEQEFAHVH